MLKKMIVLLTAILISWYVLFAVGLSTGEISLMEQYNNILKLIGKKDYNLAINALKVLIEKNPDFSRAYQKIVEAYQGKKNMDECISFFEDLIKKKTGNTCVYYGLAYAFMKKKEFGRAIHIYKKAIDLKPGFAGVYKDFVDACQKEKRDKDKILQEMESYLYQLAQKNPGNTGFYFGLGYLYLEKYEWEKSLSMLNRAIELAPGLLLAYHYKGLVFAYTSKFGKALETWELELKLAKKTKDIEIEAKVLSNIAITHDNLGNYRKAMKYYNKSLSISKEIGDKRQVGKIIGNVGVLYHQTGNYPEAVRYYNQALAVDREMGNKKSEAINLGNIGVVYTDTGEYKKGIEYYKKTLAVIREVKDRRVEGIILENIGTAYNRLGEFEKALNFYNQALAIHKEVENENQEAKAIGNIGNVYEDLGYPGKALEHYRKALAIHRMTGDKRNQGIFLGNIGAVYFKMGNEKEALNYLNQALAIHRKIGNKESECRDLDNIGVIYMELGNYPKALKFLTRALEITWEIRDKKTEAFTLANIGYVYLYFKNFDKSREYFQSSIRVGFQIQAPYIIWGAQTGLGSACRLENQYEKALAYYDKAVQTIESVRGQLKMEGLKSGFMSANINSYENIVDILFKMMEKNPFKNYSRKAFHYSERSKSRAFLDLLAESRANIKAGIDSELLKREKALNLKFSRTHSALQKERAKSKDKVNQKRVRELEEKLKNLDEAFEQLKLEMTRKNPKYAALKYPVPTTLQELQQKILDKDTVLLEYMVGEKSGYLWKVSRDNFEALKLNISREELERRVKLLRHLSETSANAPTFAAQAYVLFQKLMEPVLGNVPKGKKLLIVPDGILNYLPFEILCTKPIENRDKHRFKALSYLIKKYPVHYVQSASVWASLKQETAPLNPKTKKGPGKLLAFGDPVFRGETELSENPVIRSAFRGSEPVLFKRLLYSGKEVKTIGKLIKPSDIYLRQQAKEEKIKQLQDLNQYRYIHFATHGILNENKPQFSGLVLTQDDDHTEDGFLQMREILNLKLNADLVVLSACRTGLGKLVRGEGIIGLTRAWMYAGTPSVMVSLWAVNDASTARLMEEFYKNLKKGMTKTLALQKAKLRMLKKTGAVRGWAGFVLIGI